MSECVWGQVTAWAADSLLPPRGRTPSRACLAAARCPPELLPGTGQPSPVAPRLRGHERSRTVVPHRDEPLPSLASGSGQGGGQPIKPWGDVAAPAHREATAKGQRPEEGLRRPAWLPDFSPGPGVSRHRALCPWHPPLGCLSRTPQPACSTCLPRPAGILTSVDCCLGQSTHLEREGGGLPPTVAHATPPRAGHHPSPRQRSPGPL